MGTSIYQVTVLDVPIKIHGAWHNFNALSRAPIPLVQYICIRCLFDINLIAMIYFAFILAVIVI